MGKSARYGALGATFKISRLLQAISLIAIIGMTANFISDMVNAKVTPPSVLVGILSIVCIAALYCAITFILFLDDRLPFLMTIGADTSLLISLVVISIVAGKPLSYLDCKDIHGVLGGTSSAYAFTAALVSSLDKDGGKINFNTWVGTTRTTCYEMKSIWGLCIALCILFFLSAVCSAFLWRQSRTAPSKDVEG